MSGGLTLGDALIYLRADDSKLGSDIHGAESKAKSMIGGWATGIARTVGKVVVGGMILAAGATVGLAVKAVGKAADAEEMMSKFGVTFGKWSGTATLELDRFSDATGRNRYELMEMAANIGAVGKGMGLTEAQAAKMSVGFAQLAVDVGSFNNRQSTDVAERFQAAMSGEYESLKALGIVVNEAAVKQELLNMGIEGGKESATQAELAQARYNLIVRASADAIGDAERTSGSWTNQMVALKSKISETMTEIGLKLLPVLTPLLARLGELASEYLPKVIEALTPFIQKIGEIAGYLLDGKLKDALLSVFPPEVVDKIFEIKDAIMGFWNETLAPFIEKWVEMEDVAIVAFGAIAVFLASVLGPIIAPILAIGAVLIGAVAIVAFLRNAWENNWGGIRDKTQAVLDWLKKFISEALAKIKAWWAEHGDEVIARVTELWETVKRAFDEALRWISDLISDVLAKIKQWWGEHGDEVKEIVNGLWDGIKEIWDTATAILGDIFDAFRSAFEGDWKGFGENLREAWDKVWDLVKDAVNNAVEWIRGVDWKELGRNIINGLVAGVKAVANSLAAAAVAAVKSAVNAAKGFLGIESPSKVFMEMGRNMTMGMALGIAGDDSARIAALNLSKSVAAAAGSGSGTSIGTIDKSVHYALYPRNDGQTNSLRSYVRMLQSLQEAA